MARQGQVPNQILVTCQTNNNFIQNIKEIISPLNSSLSRARSLALDDISWFSSPAAWSANESGYTHHIDMQFGDTIASIAHVLYQLHMRRQSLADNRKYSLRVRIPLRQLLAINLDAKLHILFMVTIYTRKLTLPWAYFILLLKEHITHFQWIYCRIVLNYI